VTSWKLMQWIIKVFPIMKVQWFLYVPANSVMELLYMVNSIQDDVSFRTLFTTLKQLRKPIKHLSQNSHKSEHTISKIWSKSADNHIVIFGVILPSYKCELQGQERRREQLIHPVVSHCHIQCLVNFVCVSFCT
jgi:hypothetical protein